LLLLCVFPISFVLSALSLFFFLSSAARRDLHSFPTRRSSDLDQPLVIFPRRIAPALHDAIVACYHDAGLTPRIGQEAIQMQTIIDRKSTRLNSSHVKISYAVFCLKKKNKTPAEADPVLTDVAP